MDISAKHIENILRAFEIEPRPMDRMLDSYYRRNRGLGSKERRLISEAVFGIMRWKRRIDGVLKPEGIATNSQRISAYLEGKHIIKTDPKRFPGGPAAYWSYPDFIYDRLVKWKGSDWAQQIAAALGERAKLVIRANTQKTSRDDLQKILHDEGVKSVATKFSPFGLMVPERVNLNTLKSFKAGLFEVQDEASQLVGLFVDPKKDETIIDVCAGAGGKTLLLAMLMEGQGRLIVSDIDDRKLKILKQRARQAGVSNIEVTSPDKLKGFVHIADAVLVDAPCSGTGTLKRNPDLKWRLTEDELSKRIQEQKQILSDASRFVKRPGRLIYVTCSILPDENEEVAQWFQKKFGWESGGDYFRTDPSLQSMDGFFAAVFNRPGKG